MQTPNNNLTADFHAVEFMRKRRDELTKQLHTNKQQYLEDLKKAMENFKARQKNTHS